MRIVHAVSPDISAESSIIVEQVLKNLDNRFDFELIAPVGSPIFERMGDARVKLTPLPVERESENLLRDVYIYAKHFSKTLPLVVHSHGSVAASLGSFLARGCRPISVKDYYTSGILSWIFSVLCPKTRFNLTSSHSRSERDELVGRGVRESSIVELPYGVNGCGNIKRYSFCLDNSASVPVISECECAEECALLLSSAMRVFKNFDNPLFIVCPKRLVSHTSHLASALGIGKRILIFTPDSMPLSFAAGALFFISPSLREDVIPLRAAFYMSQGLPVIVPATPRNLDLVEEGINGLAFTPGDSFSLAECWQKLLCDRSLCSRLSLGAARDSARRLSVKEMCECYAAFYDSLRAELDGQKIRRRIP